MMQKADGSTGLKSIDRGGECRGVCRPLQKAVRTRTRLRCLCARFVKTEASTLMRELCTRCTFRANDAPVALCGRGAGWAAQHACKALGRSRGRARLQAGVHGVVGGARVARNVHSWSTFQGWVGAPGGRKEVAEVLELLRSMEWVDGALVEQLGWRAMP